MGDKPAARWQQMPAFTWGLAEASVFFIVPDVLLTALAIRSLAVAWRALAWSLGGALVGGTLMWWWGTTDVAAARAWLDVLPGISPGLIASADGQMDRGGLVGLFLGPLGGIPYKIYAVEWGARGGSFAALLFVSIPARGIRFALSALIARWVLGRLSRWTKGGRTVEFAVWGLFWVAFYVGYFSYFRG